jgi:polysaccharide biosynthesis protein PslH
MRVVVLSPHSPHPATSGGRIRLAALVAALSGWHEVRLFLLTDDSDPDIEHVRAGGVSVVRVHRTAWDRLPLRRRALHNLTALLRGTTPLFESVSDALTDARVRQEAAQADVFIVDTTSFAPYAEIARRAAPDVKILINSHDVDSALFDRLAHASRNLIGVIHKRVLAANARRLERSFHRYADAVLVVSDEDKRTLTRLDPNTVPIHVIPNAVDTDDLRPLPASRSLTIIFCGVLNYQPNVEGIRWFVERVLPTVRSRVPAVQLLLVGRRPAAEVSAYADREGIHVMGDVDDVREFYAESTVAIVPLLTGGGTRLKILEAMALGRAVVSTRLGAEGIDPSRLILADTPADFADRVAGLLEEGAPAGLIEAAIRYVEDQRSWHAIAGLLKQIISPLDSN